VAVIGHPRHNPRQIRPGLYDRGLMTADPILVLGAEDVARLLDPGALLEALAATFAAASAGRVAAPARTELRLHDDAGGLLVMPGHRPGGPVVVKHVGMYDANPGRGLPHHPATICAFDEHTGLLRAVLDATYLTAARTAGAAALSVRLAARPGARVAAVIGAGPVAATHLAMLPAVRDFDELRVASRRASDAEALASVHGARAVASIEAAVRGADVVCLCTSATAPVVAPGWLAPGAHVTSVGYAPPGGELDPAIARAGRLLVETRDAFAPPPAGCAELAGLDPADAAELGEVVAGTRAGRVADDELTVYKSMGSVVEDLAAADVVIRRAETLGAGRRIPF
jgi:ornithine cyclodeaminase/alanine dehydrogenase-like protein (mu-crystallin family)